MYSHYIELAASELLSTILAKLRFGWKFLIVGLLIFLIIRYGIPYVKTMYVSSKFAFGRAKRDGLIKFRKEKQEKLSFKWVANKMTRPIRAPLFFVKRWLYFYKKIKAVIFRKNRYQKYIQRRDGKSKYSPGLYMYLIIVLIIFIVGYLYAQE